MALVTANQFQLVPEFSRAGTGFLQGQQIRSNLDARQLAQRKAQATQFTGPALAGDEQALSNVAQIDVAQAQQIQSFLQNKSEAERTEDLRENEVLTRTAIDALSLPPDQQRPFLQRKREEFVAAGRDTSNIDRALSGNDQALEQALNQQARQGQTIATIANRLFPTFQKTGSFLVRNEDGTTQIATGVFNPATGELKTETSSFGANQVVSRLGETPEEESARKIAQKGFEKAAIARVELGTAPEIAATVAAAKAAITRSEKAFDRIEPIRKSIANIDEAMDLIDQGAETGVIAARLPSVRASSIALDNLQGRLGLDVIGETTFGALSEAELKFALSTALPKTLEGPALKAWLQKKKDTQQKLVAYMQGVATFLGTPGNTTKDFIELQKVNQLERESPTNIDLKSLSDEELLRLKEQNQ